MIPIDGSMGEGGGQILRSSLGLSLVTGKSFRLENIRAGRRKPGLMRQHVTAVKAAAEIGQAKVVGDSIGSRDLVFEPGAVEPGDYHFAVGTAGSVTLVLQAVLPALLTADGPSHLVLEGGTHNPYAPPFDFLEKAFLAVVNRMGPEVSVSLDRPGFYPAGGGRFAVRIRPAEKLNRVNLPERGEVVKRRVRAVVSSLPLHIAHREIKRVKECTDWDGDNCVAEEINNPRGPGNVVIIEIESEHVTEIFTGFGKRGVKAEAVADSALKQARQYLTSQVAVGGYLADQLIVPFALAGGGTFSTLPLTRHSKTNIDVLKMFTDVAITAEEVGKHQWMVTVGG